jgi:hypothetical protein
MNMYKYSLYLFHDLPAQKALPAADKIITLQSGFVDNASKHSLNSLKIKIIHENIST